MASSAYIFDRGRMYDAQGVYIAVMDSTGQYIDKRGNVRASGQTTIVFDDYGREVGQLSSSAPGRRAPSHAKERSTNGSLEYPDGLPFNRSGVRSQSSTGNAATPAYPRGQGYQQAQIPYRQDSSIQAQYQAYKKAGDGYATSKERYKSEAKIHSVEQKSAVGGDLEGQYFDQDGHRIMGQIAAAADMAGLTAATKRLEHTSNHYGRLPREHHAGHLQQAAGLIGHGALGSPAQRNRFHQHFSKDPVKHESDDDTPLSELDPSERRKREKRREIDWDQQKHQWEISDKDWKKMEKQRREDQARDREHYDSGRGMNRGPELEDGRYEWLAVGGGRRRYWNKEDQRYEEMREDPLERLRRH